LSKKGRRSRKPPYVGKEASSPNMNKSDRPPPYELDEPESGTVRAAVPFRRELAANREVFDKTTAPPPRRATPTDAPRFSDPPPPLLLDSASLRAPRTPSFDGSVRASVDSLGGPDAVPRIVISGTTLRALNLDHRDGFVLSCIDGFSTVEEILDIAGLERGEALAILSTLLDKGAIAFV
jgi:hypothetical protein